METLIVVLLALIIYLATGSYWLAGSAVLVLAIARVWISL